MRTFANEIHSLLNVSPVLLVAGDYEWIVVEHIQAFAWAGFEEAQIHSLMKGEPAFYCNDPFYVELSWHLSKDLQTSPIMKTINQNLKFLSNYFETFKVSE